MHNSIPIISVIIPVYNSVNYIGRCLESIRMQSFKEFEVIIVNDGSTDNSWEIIRQYSVCDIRFKAFYIENRGASLARRFGLENACGNYVTFIDSDDFVHTEYLRSLYELIINNDCRISACGHSRELVYNGTIKSSINGRCIYEQELFSRFFKYEFWGFWGKLYSKELFDNIAFPKATLSEDYYVMCQLFFKERRMIYTPVELYCWEVHSNSLSHNITNDKCYEEFENVYAVFSFVENNLKRYRLAALGNVVETSVKLLNIIKHTSPSISNVKKKQVVKKFLLSHFLEIMFDFSINTGIRYQVFKCIIS